MASLNIDYSSLPFSDRTQLGSFDFELEQMEASRFVRVSRLMTTRLTLA